ncbi:uncharacterized protein LOC121009898 [Herpailurus yagouaroundi]|uniref:uncharacterized protein LOC121009898 n=1 Tax=Herpailurus yagouaroundi TaxID=1608482 RepID=UPI001AD6A90E|nr:uncharacterized protein LOC121009898 [Puma yagouaroundi]
MTPAKARVQGRSRMAEEPGLRARRVRARTLLLPKGPCRPRASGPPPPAPASRGGPRTGTHAACEGVAHTGRPENPPPRPSPTEEFWARLCLPCPARRQPVPTAHPGAARRDFHGIGINTPNDPEVLPSGHQLVPGPRSGSLETDLKQDLCPGGKGHARNQDGRGRTEGETTPQRVPGARPSKQKRRRWRKDTRKPFARWDVTLFVGSSPQLGCWGSEG